MIFLYLFFNSFSCYLHSICCCFFNSYNIGWTIQIWISVAFIPAILYLIQNIASLTAYQHLDPITYNVLNQTKTLSAALCCYLLLGLQQSPIQILSLLILLLSALTIEGLINLSTIYKFISSILLQQSKNDNNVQMDTTTTTTTGTSTIESIRHYTHGVFPLLVASFISGLAGAITQHSLQRGSSSSSNNNSSSSTLNKQSNNNSSSSNGRNIYLFSIELCTASIIILLVSLVVSKDGILIKQYGFWYGWNVLTIIPILTNSAGGILVGLVTKHAGSVQKGFALIFGILLSALLQTIITSSSAASDGTSNISSSSVKPEQWIGGILAGLSLYLHSSYPPKKSNQQQQQQISTTSSRSIPTISTTIKKKIRPLKEE
jgi:solute carrier family 35 (UDP-sugar transporter), member A1/2/3